MGEEVQTTQTKGSGHEMFQLSWLEVWKKFPAIESSEVQ